MLVALLQYCHVSEGNFAAERRTLFQPLLHFRVQPDGQNDEEHADVELAHTVRRATDHVNSDHAGIVAQMENELQALELEDPDARLYHLTRAFRLYKMLFERAPHSTLRVIESRLFPFTKDKNLARLRESYRGRGIAVTASRHQLVFLYPLLQTLRFKLNCTLPIELLYLGDNDLNHEEQSAIKSWVPNLELVDLVPLLSAQAREIKGYNIKMLAILFSSFAEVMFIDADAVFVVNPEVLFSWPLYTGTGMLLFSDWPFEPMPFEYGTILESWIYEFMPDLDLDRATDIEVDFVRGRTRFLIEAGVVVMDKRTRFVQLMAQTCLVLPRFIDLFENRFLGDKELFWFAARMANEPLGLNPGPAGRVGTPHPDFPYTSHACGDHVAHFSPTISEPIWFNQGIYVNKHARPRRIDTFTHFSRFLAGPYQNHAFNETGCNVMSLTPDASNPVAKALSRDFQAVTSSYKGVVERMNSQASALGVPLDLPARNHSANIPDKDPLTDWKAIMARCKVEMSAMRFARAEVGLV